MIFKKILIFGQGQLGTYYREYFEGKGILVVSPRLDIRNQEAVLDALIENRPDIVINAVAKTNIDWCEMNKLECFDVNTLGADHIARSCEQQSVYLLHLSSGCVQESKTAQEVHTEEDTVHPLCFYSWTKVWAEQLLLDRMKFGRLKVLLLRPRQLLSAMMSPRNALTKMLTYTKFIDTPNSCTIVEDLMWVTDQLLQKDATGVINVANPGMITPYQIAEMLKEQVKADMVFSIISKDELNAMTLARRVDCVLSMEKLRSFGIELPEIHMRLREILILFKRNLDTQTGSQVLDQTYQETKAKLALKS